MNPAIVINAYNRPESLRRLLMSLQQAYIAEGTVLIFSLEHDAHDDVVKQAETFHWQYGEKNIIQQQKKLGLVGHFLFCGDLTTRYGTIIYLEDDLFVGHDFYKYAIATLAQYQNEERLAGFSLNALWFNGYLHLPFKPLDDGNSCFFLQVPWYQGQIYTPAQWQHFKSWYNNYKGVNHELQMHTILKNYKLTDDWFPVKTQYLIETGKYYCFPRSAQCVNFGDAGTHFANSTNFFQTELALRFDNNVFKPFDDCVAVYDSFFELSPLLLKKVAPHLKDIDLELDLNATKDLSKVKSEYVLTPVQPETYLKAYALEMRPQELNIIYDIEGKYFYLAKTNMVQGFAARKNSFYEKFLYYNRFKLTRKQKLNIFLKG